MAKPDNKEGFHKRMHTLELDEIKPEICARVKQILDGIEYTKVVAASRGGAAFYVWVRNGLLPFPCLLYCLFFIKCLDVRTKVFKSVHKVLNYHPLNTR